MITPQENCQEKLMKWQGWWVTSNKLTSYLLGHYQSPDHSLELETEYSSSEVGKFLNKCW